MVQVDVLYSSFQVADFTHECGFYILDLVTVAFAGDTFVGFLEMRILGFFLVFLSY